MERLVFLCLNNFFFIRCIVVTIRRNFLFRIEYLLLEEKHSTAVNPTRKTGFRIIAHRWSLTEIGLVPSQVNYPIFPYLLLTQSSKLKFFLSTGLFRYLNFMSFFNNKILYCLKNKYNQTLLIELVDHISDNRIKSIYWVDQSKMIYLWILIGITSPICWVANSASFFRNRVANRIFITRLLSLPYAFSFQRF